MRYYGFANFMLSSIQQGIQNFHVLGNMLAKYEHSGEQTERDIMLDWAANHKTAICLNGGNAAGVRAVYEKLWDLGHKLHLPFDKFHEDEQSLDSTMTACGIIVPSYIVDQTVLVRQPEPDWSEYFNTWGRPMDPDEIELAFFLNEFSLAR